MPKKSKGKKKANALAEPPSDVEMDEPDAVVKKEEKAVYSDSESEPEDWGAYDAEQDWTITVESEEIHSVTGKSMYIEWDEWDGRKDGSKNTWHAEALFPGDDTALHTFRKSTAVHNRNDVRESSSILFWDDLNVHNNATREHNQARAAKLKFAKSPAQQKENSYERMMMLLQESSMSLDQRPIPDVLLGRGRVVTRRSSRMPEASMSQSPTASTRTLLAPSPRILGMLGPSPVDQATSTQDRTISTSGRTRKGNNTISPPESTSTITTGMQRPNRRSDPNGSKTCSNCSKAVLGEGRRHPKTREPLCWDCATYYTTHLSDRPPSESLKRKRSASSVRKPSSGSFSLTKPSTSLSVKRPSLSPTVTRPSSSSKTATTSSCGTVTAKPRLEALSKKWTAAANQQDNAASVTFVNECDDSDEPPPNLHNFKYLENRYIWGDGAPAQPRPIVEFCACKSGCSEDVESLSAGGSQKGKGKANLSEEVQCNCMAEFALEHDGMEHPYTSDGLVVGITDRSQEVLECNKKCHGNNSNGSSATIFCQNMIAQRPRKFPLEVFKTLNRGWGVRSSHFICEGSFVGLYTGLLVSREVEKKMSAEDPAKGFSFDLDGREMPDDHEEFNEQLPQYSAVATHHGNWTRFLNHSCDPNLSLYNVVIDSMVDDNTPYIAFYAVKDIPARTEFTFYYLPSVTKLTKKGIPKFKRPKDANDCLCGAQECRGWL
ncbi:hypothetical protein BDV98DRAFT_558762 [Pterulicium gracile]|uniref:SET domain-containing protein n=1 Tax=Pterulicium gracile TaxID=1884261 RepID=A0A5C3QVQ0_9AGAR|nr:hypothetical protein BDV98DRAFT_558762 [Pterula gracilis]